MGIRKQPETERKEKFSYLSTKEKFWLAVGTVATVAAVAGIWELDANQKAGIRSTLSVEAEARIPGFARITAGGDTPQTIFGEVHNATVALDTGARCDVQYETYGDDFLGFPHKGRIVSLGTCAIAAQ